LVFGFGFGFGFSFELNFNALLPQSTNEGSKMQSAENQKLNCCSAAAQI